jgi:hypothetical protein
LSESLILLGFTLVFLVPVRLKDFGLKTARYLWHSRGRRFDPDYLHHLKDETLQAIAAFSFFLSGSVQAVI